MHALGELHSPARTTISEMRRSRRKGRRAQRIAVASAYVRIMGFPEAPAPRRVLQDGEIRKAQREPHPSARHPHLTSHMSSTMLRCLDYSDGSGGLNSFNPSNAHRESTIPKLDVSTPNRLRPSRSDFSISCARASTPSGRNPSTVARKSRRSSSTGIASASTVSWMSRRRWSPRLRGFDGRTAACSAVIAMRTSWSSSSGRWPLSSSMTFSSINTPAGS